MKLLEIHPSNLLSTLSGVKSVLYTHHLRILSDYLSLQILIIFAKVLENYQKGRSSETISSSCNLLPANKAEIAIPFITVPSIPFQPAVYVGEDRQSNVVNGAKKYTLGSKECPFPSPLFLIVLYLIMACLPCHINQDNNLSHSVNCLCGLLTGKH